MAKGKDKCVVRHASCVMCCLFFLLSGCLAQNSPLVKSQDDAQTNYPAPYLWDFGRVKEGAVLKHEFILKNESGKTLTIQNVDTSCGCTASEAEKKVLSPGEETEIKVQFDTKGYSGLTQQFIYVHTDSLDNPIIRFIIKADVVK